MLARTLSVAPVVRRALLAKAPAMSVVANRLAHDHNAPPANYKFPTMDDMLVPCGSWQEDYDNNQRKYNLHLLLGTGFLIITLLVGKYSGAFNLYMFPPEKPLSRDRLDLTCK